MPQIFPDISLDAPQPSVELGAIYVLAFSESSVKILIFAQEAVPPHQSEEICQKKPRVLTRARALGGRGFGSLF